MFGNHCETRPKEYKTRLSDQQGLPLVYVAYIEPTPWNVRGYTDTPLFSGVGKESYKTAVRFSDRIGYEGRIGLHSLPDAESFYTRSCRMVSLGSDPDYEDLVYFESRPTDAPRKPERDVGQGSDRKGESSSPSRCASSSTRYFDLVDRSILGIERRLSDLLPYLK